MPKKLLRRFSPSAESIKNNKYLKIFGDILHCPRLWALNRRSTAGAFAIGLFCAWLPLPFQMLIAAGLAIFFSSNLPVAIGLVWITNPITMPVMFYAAYIVGANLLGVDARPNHSTADDFSFEWLVIYIKQLWPCLLLGCSILAVSSAGIGYLFITHIWKYSTRFKWKKRRKKPQVS